jgi:hypothetical protein
MVIDDGNNRPNDGCFNCTAEKGWDCPIPAFDSPSVSFRKLVEVVLKIQSNIVASDHWL